MGVNPGRIPVWVRRYGYRRWPDLGHLLHVGECNAALALSGLLLKVRRVLHFSNGEHGLGIRSMDFASIDSEGL